MADMFIYFDRGCSQASAAPWTLRQKHWEVSSSNTRSSSTKIPVYASASTDPSLSLDAVMLSRRATSGRSSVPLNLPW